MMFKDKYIHKLYAFALAAVFAIALAGCGGGGGTAEEPPPPMPTPQETCEAAGNHWVDGACLTPSENTVRMALAAIAAAATAADAQAAYDAVKDDVSAAQGDALQAAVDARAEELATMARIDAQKMALADAAGAIDTSDLTSRDAVTAANMAIAALEAAIAAADDVDDTSMYQTMVDNAKAAVATAVAALNLDDARDTQMMALSSASEALTTALAALTGAPTQAQIDAVQTAVDALNAAIQGGMDLTDAEKASAETAVATAEAQINLAKKTLAANNQREEEEREAREEEERKAAEEKAAEEAAAMAATAAKLYAGIGAPTANDATPETSIRFAAYNTDNDAIEVQNGVSVANAVELSEDKDATVAAQYGWTGKRLTAEPEGNVGTYEAVVYSNVGEPTEGDPFDEAYTLVETATATVLVGEVGIDGRQNTGRIDSSSFDQGAGTKTFKLSPSATRVMLSGSYHGVSGTYYCTPTGTAVCAARVASDGFELGTVVSATDSTFTAAATGWSFRPANAKAKVKSVADNEYSSYGWWLHTGEDGKLTASAFHDFKGADETITLPPAGTATYMGGAAGKYALSSATGGTNDAGHFTARATLEAKFGTGTTSTISGTIDSFVGGDGESRDWSVELMKQNIGAGGIILGDDGTGTPKQTKWTIDGTAASADGQWSGNLREMDGDLPSVATGTFHSIYGTAGRMVGGFGANKQ